MCFIFINLIQIEEKVHLAATVRFLDYAFNENRHMYCFHKCDVFLMHLFFWQTRKLKSKSLLSLEKKRTCACAIFGKICYATWAINGTDKLIFLRVWLHDHDLVGLIDKPNLYSIKSSLKFVSSRIQLQYLYLILQVS